MNWNDLAIIFLFTLFYIVREIIPLVSRKDIADSKVLIIVLTAFRFFWYAMPLYVADTAFIQFIVNVLNGQPFIETHSLFIDILRFSIIFGVFGLTKIIYPPLTVKYLNSISTKIPKLSDPTDKTFYYFLNETMYKPFLFVVLYVCILLTVVVPFGLYVFLIQCPPGSFCWLF